MYRPIVLDAEKDESIGLAAPLDALANLDRRRRRPDPTDVAAPGALSTGQRARPKLVELAYQQNHRPAGE